MTTVPRVLRIALACLFAPALGCEDPGHVVAAQDSEAAVTHAVAVLHPTEGNSTRGVVRFEQRGAQVRVTAELEGLSPGAHGFHVHELGDCSAPDASSAGSHFDPDDHPHALPPNRPRHAGDLGNIEARAGGRARYDQSFDGFSLSGRSNAVLGRAVIVHADRDTGRGPSGEAGARLACGVIGVAAAPR